MATLIEEFPVEDEMGQHSAPRLGSIPLVKPNCAVRVVVDDHGHVLVTFLVAGFLNSDLGKAVESVRQVRCQLVVDALTDPATAPLTLRGLCVNDNRIRFGDVGDILHDDLLCPDEWLNEAFGSHFSFAQEFVFEQQNLGRSSLLPTPCSFLTIHTHATEEPQIITCVMFG